MVIRSTLIPSPKETTKTISCDKKETWYIVEILLRKKQKKQVVQYLFFPQGCVTCFCYSFGRWSCCENGGWVNFTRPLGRKGWQQFMTTPVRSPLALFVFLIGSRLEMVCHFWHQLLTQFSLLFQVVPFFFLSMAALRTTTIKLSDWLLELFQPIRLWLSELPWRAKWMVPSERALKTKSETGVKSFTPFYWGSSLRKTNSGYSIFFIGPGWRSFHLCLIFAQWLYDLIGADEYHRNSIFTPLLDKKHMVVFFLPRYVTFICLF